MMKLAIHPIISTGVSDIPKVLFSQILSTPKTLLPILPMVILLLLASCSTTSSQTPRPMSLTKKPVFSMPPKELQAKIFELEPAATANTGTTDPKNKVPTSQSAKTPSVQCYLITKPNNSEYATYVSGVSATEAKEIWQSIYPNEQVNEPKPDLPENCK